MCLTPGVENTAARCSDGSDNDEDGYIDCADFSCQTFQAFEAMCDEAWENTDAECMDAGDNDLNGFLDCEDFNCRAGNPNVGVCAAFEQTEATCADEVDNDDDGTTDCADGLCAAALGCGGAGFVELGSDACQDRIDNDSDGLRDCWDAEDCGDVAACAPSTTVVLSEVLYNRESKDLDDGYEWVEIYNGTSATVDLAGWEIRWGGPTINAETTLPAGFTIAAAGCVVVGGPSSDASNASPSYDLVLDFEPNLQNAAEGPADAVLLANDGGDIVDGVIYGGGADHSDADFYPESNLSGLPDESGTPGTVDVWNVNAGASVVRIGDETWWSDSTPSPGDCSLIAGE